MLRTSTSGQVAHLRKGVLAPLSILPCAQPFSSIPPGAGCLLRAASTPDLELAKGKNSLGLERFLHSNASGFGRACWTNEKGGASCRWFGRLV